MFQELTQVGRHSIVYSAGVFLQRVASFLLVPLFTIYFSTADYGQMDILSNTATVMTTLLALGLVSGMYRSYFMHKDEERRMDIAKTGQVIFMGSALFVIILLFFVKPLSAILLGDEGQSSLIILVLISIILSNLLLVPFSVLRAKGQSIRYVIYSLIQFSVNIGITIFLVAVARRGVQGNFEGMVIGQIVVLLLFSGLFIRMFRARFSWDDAKEMLAFGLPLVPAMLFAISMTVADRYFLRAYSTFDEIGVYGLGYKIGLIVSVIIVTPFMLSWSPMMWSVAEKPFAKSFYAKVLTYFLAIGLFIALALSILSPDLIRLMSARESYWRAWQVVPFIALAYVFYGLYLQMGVGIKLKKKTTYIPFIVGAAALLNLLLNYLLIPRMGMIGAAIATILSYSALVILVYFVSQPLYPLPYEWGRLAKLSVLFLIMLGLGFLISADSVYLTITLKSFFLLLFPITLLLVRFFKPEELAHARELLAIALTKINKRFRRVKSSES